MRILSVVFLLMQAGTAMAGLEWDRMIISTHASPEDGKVKGSYHFKNTGKETVRILAVRPSCGCTAAKPTIETVKPGDEGDIGMEFDIGDRKGKQYKTITVSTDDKEKQDHILALEVFIDQALEMDRTVVLWRKNDPPVPKTLNVKVARAEPLKLVKAEAKTPGFDVKLETVTEGREYRLVIAPTSTAEKASASIQVSSEEENGHAQTITARARVK